MKHQTPPLNGFRAEEDDVFVNIDDHNFVVILTAFENGEVITGQLVDEGLVVQLVSVEQLYQGMLRDENDPRRGLRFRREGNYPEVAEKIARQWNINYRKNRVEVRAVGNVEEAEVQRRAALIFQALAQKLNVHG